MMLEVRIILIKPLYCHFIKLFFFYSMIIFIKKNWFNIRIMYIPVIYLNAFLVKEQLIIINNICHSIAQNTASQFPSFLV